MKKKRLNQLFTLDPSSISLNNNNNTKKNSLLIINDISAMDTNK